jgi:tRNA 2-thiouridine synthesizing protein E
MAIEVNGKSIETTANGYLANIEDWNEEVAKVLAESDGISLTDEHWALINYLRDEYVNNAGNQPNNRFINKHMAAAFPDKNIDSKYLFILFPGTPSKQAGRIAGLPESRRKGGY